MIARIWSGKTLEKDGDEYMAYLQATGIKDYRETEGNRGVYVLRRTIDGTVEFVLISFWESMDAIRRFAGDETEKAIYYPEDEAYLLELQPGVEHYELTVFS